MKTLLFILIASVSFFANAEDLEKREERDANLYSSFGKRDPFRSPDRGGLANEEAVDPLRRFRLEGYRLRAILRTGARPQAMFEDPDGKSHVVVEGNKLGMEGARVSRIVNSEVIVTERTANYLGKETLLEKVISLPVEVERQTAGAPSSVQQGFPGDAAQTPPPGNPGPVSSGASPAPPAAPGNAIQTAPPPAPGN